MAKLPRTQYYTRTRLLNQLGFVQPPKAKPINCSPDDLSLLSTSSVAPAVSGDDVSKTVLGDAVRYETPINDLEAEHAALEPVAETTSLFSAMRLMPSSASSSSDDSSEVPPKTTTSPPTTSSRRLRFHDTVSVVAIPSRNQYSDRIKQCIWSNKWELREMAQRNLVEFESEGYDWNNVVMEEDMYIDSKNGSLIHPCHVDAGYKQKNNADPSEEEEDGACFVPLQRKDTMSAS
mmetsp:Transcript_298/g.828  ORF Transcript_298/g.828 Transcript_298/m.828 type:complete len:234 (-) Transcript_298:171-872(-)